MATQSRILTMGIFSNVGISMMVAPAIMVTAAAQASTPIEFGTVTVVNFFNPTINTTIDPATFAITFATSQIYGTGDFADVTNLFGQINGTILFSNTVNDVIIESISNFFVFDDAHGGTYNFSVASVRTNSYNINPGISNSFSFYLLGTTLDTNLGRKSSLTSLTISVNNTGDSLYSGSATLAVRPLPSLAPEPSTWAMGMAGFGAIGLTMRRRTRTSLASA